MCPNMCLWTWCVDVCTCNVWVDVLGNSCVQICVHGHDVCVHVMFGLMRVFTSIYLCHVCKCTTTWSSMYVHNCIYFLLYVCVCVCVLITSTVCVCILLCIYGCTHVFTYTSWEGEGRGEECRIDEICIFCWNLEVLQTRRGSLILWKKKGEVLYSYVFQ